MRELMHVRVSRMAQHSTVKEETPKKRLAADWVWSSGITKAYLAFDKVAEPSVKIRVLAGWNL